ncbi:MAG: hypothetical protein GY803_29170 [Chloroflexi bacterium]|nr:hypothetical protein [Chloroflexota bacterium]
MSQLHLTANRHDEALCRNCHADKLSENQQDVLPSHALHLESPLLTFECTHCHPSVDLAQESAGSLRRQVDTKLCAACHSQSPHADEPDLADQTCIECHEDWQTQMGQTDLGEYVGDLDVVTSDDCAGCRGEGLVYGRFSHSIHANHPKN